MAGPARTIASLSQISDRYAAILCDVWGVVHNGVDAFAAAARALEAARSRGTAVILVTNAPRPHRAVEAQLAGLGVRAAAFDRVVSSGDVTRELIAGRPATGFFISGPNATCPSSRGSTPKWSRNSRRPSWSAPGCATMKPRRRTTMPDCCAACARANLPLICANPDMVVERGDRLVWCAGALARDYALLGGRMLIAGKPHAPIYAAALKAAGEVLGREVARSETLAIGDGMLTDIKGADENGIRRALRLRRHPRRRVWRRSDDPDPAKARCVPREGMASPSWPSCRS